MRALEANGLAKVAPAILGDFFPTYTPQQLKRKGSHICNGAVPQVHAHFFTDTGSFGSIDQYGQQVDDGYYNVLNDHVLTINDARFGYRVTKDILVLRPLISARYRKAALDAPWHFSTAAWQVSVTYDGLPWHSTACQGWC